MRGFTRLTLTCAPLMLALASCADGVEVAAENDTAVIPSDTAELAAASDGQWLSLTGTVVTATPNAFVLDYGAGNVTVEMDDWDSYQEGRILKAGDQVTVSGLADQDLLQKKRIEAQSVYVRNLNSFFFANGADEEEFRASAAVTANVATYADFTGTVSAIEGREFTLGAGTAAVRVDTSLLRDNPLDSQGAQQLEVGDRVFAWGDIDLDAAEGAELKAHGLVSLVASGAARSTPPAGAPDLSLANEAQPENAMIPVTNDTQAP